MADQTIEIRLIMRDELSKAMDAAFANMRKHDATMGVGTGRAQTAFHGLARAIQPVHRELSSLARLSLGGLIGGGVVAGIVSVGKALQDMAQKGMQLHYTAQSLGVSTTMLDRYSDAMMAVGQSQEQGAAGIQTAIGSLRDLQVEGNKSSVWQQLEKGARGTGVKLARELMGEMNGPRGMEGALRLLLHRMQGMNPEAQRAISKMFGLGTVGARDLLEILPQLHKRLELSASQQRALLLANTNLNISWDNIKTRLATVLIPIFERLATSLDKFLQSPAGKEFIKRLESWGKEMGDAFDAWLKGGGLNRAAEDMKGTLDTLWAGFTEADKVIKAMETSWPAVIASLIGLRLLAPILTGIGTALLGISKIPNVLTLLPMLAPFVLAGKDVSKLWGKSPAEIQAELDKTTKEAPDTLEKGKNELKDALQWLWNLLPGGTKGGTVQPQSGTDDEGLSKSPQERRADLQEKKRATKQLTDELDKFNYSFAKLNTNLMPGGPEGGKGPSGFQFDRDAPGFDISSVKGPAGKGGPSTWPKLPGWATPLSAIPGTVRPAQTSGQGFASWYGNRPDIGFRDKKDKGRQGVTEADQGIALGSMWKGKGAAGDYHYLTDPFTGLTHVTRQSDTGPNIRTQNLVDIHASQLHRMGYSAPGRGGMQFPSGKGIWGVEPAFPSFDKEPSGLNYRQNYAPSGLERSLAQANSAASGSANIDIDVSGVGQSRDASALFRGAPMEGNIQMQDPPHVPNNPNNYQ